MAVSLGRKVEGEGQEKQKKGSMRESCWNFIPE